MQLSSDQSSLRESFSGTLSRFSDLHPPASTARSDRVTPVDEVPYGSETNASINREGQPLLQRCRVVIPPVSYCYSYFWGVLHTAASTRRSTPVTANISRGAFYRFIAPVWVKYRPSCFSMTRAFLLNVNLNLRIALWLWMLTAPLSFLICGPFRIL